jgi:electron transfer flavoprotein alpha subunit
MSTIVVHVEQEAGKPTTAGLEALGAAVAAGASPAVAVVCGPDAASAAEALGAAGASRVVAIGGLDTHSPDALAAELAGVATESDARAFLASATATGRDIAPRVAAHLDVPLFSDCVGFEANGDGFAMTRPQLAGKVVSKVRSTASVTCATLRRNVFSPAEGGGTAELVERAASAAAKVTRTGISEKEAGKLDVSEAPVIVSGGRGMKEAEGFGILEELASALGNAAVGASRAVVDAGWRPHAEQVGQTGKTVAPQLYIAVGISGAIQHLAGMKTAKVIVAINKDAEAPIFKVADYGIVGDAFEIVPALTEAVRAVRANG